MQIANKMRKPASRAQCIRSPVRSKPHPYLLLLLGACEAEAPSRPPEAALITVEDRTTAPWRVERAEAGRTTFRMGDSGHGVHVDLAQRAGHPPGFTLIHAGRAWSIDEDAIRWPMIALPWSATETVAVTAETQGPDLILRASGPSLRVWAQDPSAPADPAITWVRLRARGDDWRVVVDGLAQLSWPAGTLTLAPGAGWRLAGDWGEARFDTDAPAVRTRSTAHRYLLDTQVSLASKRPYPRVAFTFQPKGAQPLTPPAVSPSTK